jgi:mono/diheme cytochrome c family protein
VKLAFLSSSVLILGFGLAAWSQSKTATVLDGVYTEKQAEAGKEQYEAICAACHDGDEPEAPAPKGPEFIEKWREAPVSFLFNFIHTNMPGDKPGSLTEASSVNIVAYVLEVNGYPKGTSELTAAKTRDILLVGPGGPKPLPANSLVSVVGCLAGSGDTWTLSSGTNPSRVRVGDETNPEELAASRSAALGTASYTLRNAEDFPASKMTGHKVQVKGVLTKAASPFSLSVQSLESVNDTCGK